MIPGAGRRQVVSIDEDGTTGLSYLGDDMAAMPRDGFVQVDAGTCLTHGYGAEATRNRAGTYSSV